MKILFIWDGEYPWDIRVEKCCETLMKEGHEIHLVCRNRFRLPRYELYKGIHIHRIRAVSGILFNKINEAFTFPFFLSPIWLMEIYRQIRKNDCRIVIIRDLPMAPAALLVGKLLGKKVVLDMAECYPEMLRCTWKFGGIKLKNIILRNPILADIVEKLVLRWIDHVIVVIDESLSRLVRMGVNPKKISIVKNTPVHERFISARGEKKDEAREYKLLYVGLLNPPRGIDTTIEAVKHYILNGGDASSFRFMVIGTGKAEKQLHSQVERLGLQGVVRFLGWIDNKKVPDYVRESDICIVPHYRCGHWDNTIPNKLFDYMAAGKPVIVSDVKPAKRIVESTGCGVVYKDTDPADLARSIKLLEDLELRETMGQRGQQAVMKEYNWAVDEKNLISLVASIGKNG